MRRMVGGSNQNFHHLPLHRGADPDPRGPFLTCAHRLFGFGAFGVLREVHVARDLGAGVDLLSRPHPHAGTHTAGRVALMMMNSARTSHIDKVDGDY